jgi:glyoxylase-like metal-dependent hydrolase (beta-lactamase superfamily II)
MRTTSVTDNLIQLTRVRFVNAYLVREDDGFTLVDTTIGGSADALIAAAAAGGGLDALKERLGDSVSVLMPDLDARIHAGENVVEGKVPGSWPKLRTTPDVRLSDGDRVESLEVISTPGHTPGHVAFRDPRDGTLVVGDVFTTYGHPAVSNHFYWRFPFATMATWDKAKDLESARRLRALEPTTLAAGHGPAVRVPTQAMDLAIERSQRALG